MHVRLGKEITFFVLVSVVRTSSDSKVASIKAGRGDLPAVKVNTDSQLKTLNLASNKSQLLLAIHFNTFAF